ncbi:hypothetical protein [Larkinella rosea]|uniref:SGNH/GDSL hydrolase family protein n=1 Tax=Larkinella rosea TaxID=2025312 RepID=A0A3P1BT43_9BACT|nr:hypothetical protein [Larkinella rosea]RRB04227.1 hypothetical protein EHT25_11955 [Larkinella rosea]
MTGVIKKYIVDSFVNFQDFYYRVKNSNRPKLLIYTDSRGFNVGKKLGKIPHNTYVSMLRKRYHIHYAICPEKYTTIVDFLNFVQKHNSKEYDAVIFHCGVVDFSPRPLSNLENFKDSKKTTIRFTQIFKENQTYYAVPFNCLYKEEKTINIYSINYMVEKLIPDLQKIPNLIWINSNRFVKGWEGNYQKGRPKNIDEVVNQFDSEMSKYLSNIIDLKRWSPEEVMKYTIDNIHFNKTGFKVVYSLLENKIQEVIGKRSKQMSV